MPGELTISHAALHDDGESTLTLVIQLQNSGTRTMHAYASVRALRYDASTKTLEVQLSDRGLQEMGGSGNFLLPNFTSIDPEGDAHLSISLPRTIARPKPSTSPRAMMVAWAADHATYHLSLGEDAPEG
jgi:hypothetical protein